MRLRYLALCAALLATAACDDERSSPLAPDAPAAGPRLATTLAAPTWTIFTNQTPTETLDAAPGWEVSTRFQSSKPGRVVGFRFWRAVGETGTNTAKLWSDNGTRLRLSNAFPSGTGWVETRLSSPIALAPNTPYRVSVNTNTRQVKKGGAFYFDGSIDNGPLHAGGSHYGQPIHAMPTSGSASMFFVDVIFEEDLPLPNLLPTELQALSTQTRVRVCNNGAGPAAASNLRVIHTVRPLTPPQYSEEKFVYTPPIAAGACVDVIFAMNSSAVAFHDYAIWVDYFQQVQESNENDNYQLYNR